MKINCILFIATVLLLSSCRENNGYDLLYNQLLNYRDELKWDVASQRDYLFEKSNKNDFIKRRFDSLNKFNSDLEKSFQNIKYGKRNPIIELRDNYNVKHQLGVKFEPSYDDAISDSIFNRLIEIDFFRLEKEFQNKKMFLSRGHH